jgi:hypothetical protein
MCSALVLTGSFPSSPDAVTHLIMRVPARAVKLLHSLNTSCYDRVMSDVVMRMCAHCEEIHPERFSVSWSPDRLYFCSNGCWQEWAEQAGY